MSVAVLVVVGLLVALTGAAVVRVALGLLGRTVQHRLSRDGRQERRAWVS